MFRKTMKKIFLLVSGKRRFQRFFERLYRLSLMGMNIGGAFDLSGNGERFVLQYISGRLQSADDLVVFDVGANIGRYSLLAKNVLGGKAVIHAFEPSRQTFEMLSSGVEECEAVVLHNFGFGKEEKKAALFSNETGSGMASIYERRLEHFDMKMNLKEEVEIKTIDGFCKSNRIKRIHFLKIDAEGHELKILDGASDMLNSGAIDFIQFEFGGCNIDSRTFFQNFYYLLKNRYRIFRILRDGLFPIDEYKEIYEAFITTNYLAERR